MAPAGRREAADLTARDALFAGPQGYDFFQAVRLLRLAMAGREGPGAAMPNSEAIRFRVLQSLAFPASQIYDLVPPGDDGQAIMTVTFMGLTGPSGALPNHYTEMIRKLERDERGPERRALRDYFDLFNNRLIGLFYKAWEKYRFWTRFERGRGPADAKEPFTRTVFSLCGLGLKPVRGRLTVRDRGDRELARVDDLAVAYYAGLLAQRPANAANLRLAASDHFGVTAEVEQFRGKWIPVEPGLQTCLGRTGRVGVNALAGSRVWDVQSQFRLRVGPLTYRRFTELLPDRDPESPRKEFFLLCHFARLFAGPELEFDVQLVLAAAEAPECRLADRGLGARLGWNCWLITRTPEHDLDDPVFPGEVVTRLP